MRGRRHLTGELIGRETELTRLSSLLEHQDGATGRGPNVALLGGDAGVGKTRLLQALIAAAPDGTTVLAGWASPGSLGRPFDTFRNVVASAVSEWERVPEPLRGRSEAVGRLLHPVAPQLPRPDVDVELDELLRAAVAIVEHLAGGADALVVIDDLHWADGATVEVVDRLSVEGTNLVLVASYRPSELNPRHPAAELLTRLERRQMVEHLRLGPLDVRGVRELVRSITGCRPDAITAKELHTRTGGNPFFLEALFAASPGATPTEVVAKPLPLSVSEVLRPQVEQLPAEAREVAQAAAVLGSLMGSRMSFDQLVQVSGREDETLIRDLRTLVERGLLTEDEPDRFRFRHELVRETVLVGMLGREKRRLHERALELALADEDPDYAAIAKHAQGAHRPDLMLDAARRGAPRYLEYGSTHQALTLAEEGLAERPDDLGLLAVAARAAWMLGLMGDASQHAEALRESAQAAGDVLYEFEADRLLLRLAWELADEPGRQAMIAEVERLADSLDGEPLAQAFADLAQTKMLAGDDVDAVRLADEAIELANAVGAKRIAAQAMVERATAQLCKTGKHKGKKGARTDELRAAVEAAEAAGDQVAAARGLNNMFHAFNELSEEEEDEVLNRLGQVTRSAGFASLNRSSYLVAKALRIVRDGDLASALAKIRDRNSVLEARVDRHSAGVEVEAVLLIESGKVDQAAGVIRSVGAETPDAAAVLAVLDCLRGQPGDATPRVAQMITEPDGDSDWRLPWALPFLIRAGVDAGAVDAAVDDFCSKPAEFPHCVALARALVTERDGDAAAAHDSFAEAKAIMNRRAPVFTHAEILVGLARTALQLGQESAAQEAAAEAVRLLERWPGPRRDDAVALDERLSGRVATEAAPGLTARETEVAGLLAEGLTNGQIADRLYISRKTAAAHVSNILAKLGMSSRTEVAAWVVREGIAAAAESGRSRIP